MTAAPTILLRDARLGDETAVAVVHVRSWQAAYRGLLPDDYLDSLDSDERARRYTFASDAPTAPSTIVAVDGATIVGFATLRHVTPDVDAELAALYVDPAYWDRKVGAALIVAARDRFTALGAQTAHLWLLEGNRRAERFYRQDGWAPDGRRSQRVWGVDVIELGFCRQLP